MENKAKIRKKIMLTILMSVIALIMAIVFQYHSGNNDQHLIYKGKMTQRILENKEKDLHAILAEILSFSTNENPFISFCNSDLDKQCAEKGFTIFLYQDDSLLFWSNNTVPAIKTFNPGLFSLPLIHYGSGWFRIINEENSYKKAIGLILIKNDYPYQNDYLVNDFQKDFQLGENINLSTASGAVNIYSGQGEFLFSLKEMDNNPDISKTNLLAFFFFLLFFVSILFVLFHLYHLFEFLQPKPFLLFILFSADAILLRFILLYFEIPGCLYHTDLFGPYYFATSIFSPSLADLVVNSTLWLVLAWIFYDKTVIDFGKKNEKFRITASFLLMVVSSVFFFLMIVSLKKLVLDSNVELNLNNIFNVNLQSALGFLAITFMILAFFLFSSKTMTSIIKNGIKSRTFIFLVLISIALISIAFQFSFSTGPGIVFPILLMAYMLSFLYFARQAKGYKNMTGALLYIVFFSLITTFIIDFYYNIKEKETRKILASKLTSRRDPLMEFEFSRIRQEIEADSALAAIIDHRMPEGENDSMIINYLTGKYFTNYWNKYDLLITACHKNEVLNIQPGDYLSNCYEYFNSRMNSPAAENVGSGLYFLDNRMDNFNYMGVFNFRCKQQNHQDSLRIFVELFYKYVPESGLGYPDLLIDKKVRIFDENSGYSYAKYVNGKLIYKNGDFVYNLGFQAYNNLSDTDYFLERERYSHYIIKSGADNALIISKKTLTPLDLIAPFSYLFILFSLSMVLFWIGYHISRGFSNFEFNFRNRLQLAVIAIIILSFIVLGMITRSNIIHLYDNKNSDNLSEKAFSVLTELEHKIGNETRINGDLKGYVADLLYKFSMIFYSDINLYDTKGELIASSRPQIFEEQLLSAKMNSKAFCEMITEQSLLYIQNEKIGRQEYLSAYIPFRNMNDQIIAYINLPYFAKQTELQKEIGDFLAAYINVYVMLIVIASMITIFISRLITRPLQLIREKLGNVALGKPNEKIKWNSRDEIGHLVEEYNRMIDELTSSAELLARSERESAWREMAKQVAHEIKNPLTPMKLSVQFLQKAWDEKAPDWDKQLKVFTTTIVEQIDSLSEIASEFSDFAKMPAPVMEKIDLAEVIGTSMELFRHHRNISIEVSQTEKEYPVIADGKQLLRAFNNLLQNAVQAIGKKDDGLIIISLSREEAYYRVDISDNGTGITEEQAVKIFSPSFTTKSSGMGLGLAMVKSIMTTINGSVTFKSAPGEGTTFTLKIPVCVERAGN